MLPDHSSGHITTATISKRRRPNAAFAASGATCDMTKSSASTATSGGAATTTTTTSTAAASAAAATPTVATAAAATTTTTKTGTAAPSATTTTAATMPTAATCAAEAALCSMVLDGQVLEAICAGADSGSSDILIVKQNRKNLKSPTHICRMCGYGDFSSQRLRRHLMLRHHAVMARILDHGSTSPVPLQSSSAQSSASSSSPPPRLPTVPTVPTSSSPCAPSYPVLLLNSCSMPSSSSSPPPPLVTSAATLQPSAGHPNIYNDTQCLRPAHNDKLYSPSASPPSLTTSILADRLASVNRNSGSIHYNNNISNSNNIHDDSINHHLNHLNHHHHLHHHFDSEPESPLSVASHKMCVDDLPEDLSVHSDVSSVCHSDNDENVQVVPQFKPQSQQTTTVAAAATTVAATTTTTTTTLMGQTHVTAGAMTACSGAAPVPLNRVGENKRSVIMHTPRKASKRSASTNNNNNNGSNSTNNNNSSSSSNNNTSNVGSHSILKRRLLGLSRDEPAVILDDLEASEASLNASELNVKMVYSNAKFVIDSSESFWLKGYKLPPRYELAPSV